MNSLYPSPGDGVNPGTPGASAGALGAVRIDTTPVVDAIGRIAFEGNVIPHAWYQHPSLRHDDGKANLVAITVLADICYWYRPTYHHDELTGALRAVTKKFAADQLQWDHAQRAERFGLTKRQVQDAFAFLKARRIIKSDPRPQWQLPNGHMLYNAVFVEPVPDAIAALSAGLPIPDASPSPAADVGRGEEVSRLNGTPIPFKRGTPPGTAGDPSRLNGGPLPVQREPNTEISTKTSPETLNVGGGVDRHSGPGGERRPARRPKAPPPPVEEAGKEGAAASTDPDYPEAVTQAAALFDDEKSLRRYAQLYDLCANNRGMGFWQDALRSTARAMQAGTLRKPPGAYFCGTLANLLIARGVSVPVGSREERDAVQSLVRESLGLNLD